MDDLQSRSLLECLPPDAHIKIVSLLRHGDVFALGKCNRFWRDLCSSNSTWKILSINRWPLLSTMLANPPPIQDDSATDWCKSTFFRCSDFYNCLMDWRKFYCYRHADMFVLALTQLYKTADLVCTNLAKGRFSFIDVELHLFRPRPVVFLNMIGILYSIWRLQLPRQVIVEALRRRGIHNRKVSIRNDTKNYELYEALVPQKNRDSILTLEDVALGRRGIETLEDVALGSIGKASGKRARRRQRRVMLLMGEEG